MSAEISIRDIKGGDTVLLKSGNEVVVWDIQNNFILVSCLERYHVSEIKKIVKRLGEHGK